MKRHELLSIGGARVIVVGGGRCGIEAATGLAARGHRVTLLHRHAALMNRWLDAGAAERLADRLRQRGIDVRTGIAPAVLAHRAGRVSGVVVTDGHYLPADSLVFATGSAPETALARRAGIEIGHGVIVDDGQATSAPGIFALGDCCEHTGRTRPLREQLRRLAARLPSPAATAVSPSASQAA